MLKSGISREFDYLRHKLKTIAMIKSTAWYLQASHNNSQSICFSNECIALLFTLIISKQKFRMFISIPHLYYTVKIEFTIFSAIQPSPNLGTPRSFSTPTPETSTENWSTFPNPKHLDKILLSYWRPRRQSGWKFWITDSTYSFLTFFLGKLFSWLLYSASWKTKCTKIMPQSWYNLNNGTQSFTISCLFTI